MQPVAENRAVVDVGNNRCGREDLPAVDPALDDAPHGEACASPCTARAPGASTQTAFDPLFAKTHALTLTGPTAGHTYYFVVRGADRSGNQAVSGEYQVNIQTKTYLPAVLRGR